MLYNLPDSKSNKQMITHLTEIWLEVSLIWLIFQRFTYT